MQLLHSMKAQHKPKNFFSYTSLVEADFTYKATGGEYVER